MQNSAFASCDSLKTISIDGEELAVGSSVFMQCDTLEEIRFTGTISFFDRNLVSKCRSLKRLYLPKKIAALPQGFISVEDSFEAIIYDGTVAEWNAVKKDANWYTSSSSFTVICTDGEIKY